MSENKPQTDEEVNELMDQELMKFGSIVPTLKALCIIAVNDHGGVINFSVYKPGGRLILLAGITLAEHDLVEVIKRSPDHE